MEQDNKWKRKYKLGYSQDGWTIVEVVKKESGLIHNYIWQHTCGNRVACSSLPSNVGRRCSVCKVSAPKPKNNPCFYCDKYIDGCNWSKFGKPVDGWIAEETTLLSTGGNNQKIYSRTYSIKYCPEFVRTKRIKGERIGGENKFAFKLANGIVMRAVCDYLKAGYAILRGDQSRCHREIMEDCIRFFKSDWFDSLFPSYSGDCVIRNLNKRLKEYADDNGYEFYL